MTDKQSSLVESGAKLAVQSQQHQDDGTKHQHCSQHCLEVEQVRRELALEWSKWQFRWSEGLW